MTAPLRSSGWPSLPTGVKFSEIISGFVSLRIMACMIKVTTHPKSRGGRDSGRG